MHTLHLEHDCPQGGESAVFSCSTSAATQEQGLLQPHVWVSVSAESASVALEPQMKGRLMCTAACRHTLRLHWARPQQMAWHRGAEWGKREHVVRRSTARVVF